VQQCESCDKHSNDYNSVPGQLSTNIMEELPIKPFHKIPKTLTRFLYIDGDVSKIRVQKQKIEECL